MTTQANTSPAQDVLAAMPPALRHAFSAIGALGFTGKASAEILIKDEEGQPVPLIAYSNLEFNDSGFVIENFEINYAGFIRYVSMIIELVNSAANNEADVKSA